MESWLSPLLSSRTRVKLLLRLFANPGSSAYLRELAQDFGVSTNAVRGELSRLSAAQLLKSFNKGREVHYQANSSHPLFGELVAIAQKTLGIDQVVESIVRQLGDLKMALLTGDYADGKDSGVIDLVLVGRVDQAQLAGLVARTEKHLGRKIRTLCLSEEEHRRLAPSLEAQPRVLLWEQRQEAAS
jgi:hypothetical protein